MNSTGDSGLAPFEALIGNGSFTSMASMTSAAPLKAASFYDHRDNVLFVVYGVVGTVVNSFGFLGNILTLIVLLSMHPRTSVTLYIIGELLAMHPRT